MRGAPAENTGDDLDDPQTEIMPSLRSGIPRRGIRVLGQRGQMTARCSGAGRPGLKRFRKKTEDDAPGQFAGRGPGQ